MEWLYWQIIAHLTLAKKNDLVLLRYKNHAKVLIKFEKRVFLNVFLSIIFILFVFYDSGALILLIEMCNCKTKKKF